MRRKLTLAVASVALLAGCWRAAGGLHDGGERRGEGPAGRAAVEPRGGRRPGTAAVLAGVKQALEAVFSYDTANLGALEKAETYYLNEDARKQVEALFGVVKNSTEQLKISTRVIDSAAVSLTRQGARVLVALSQASAKPGGTTTNGLATVLVTAAPEGQRWRLSQIEANPHASAEPAQPPGPSGPQALAATRDAAVAGARRVISTLLTLDPKDAEGTYARYETVVAEPLLSQYQQLKATYLGQMRDTGTSSKVDPGTIAATTEVDVTGGKVKVLITVTASVAAQGQNTKKNYTLRMDLVRQDSGWKAVSFEQVVIPPTCRGKVPLSRHPRLAVCPDGSLHGV
ncbi:hypothetical protein [Amycolatopsis sp. H20-H5]|uniref:hypothetical protein n=1 Tax=Amycolatopsis sp. H20-H5 TaxID=3046309 RepID=UPI002DBF5CEE|nr:hypothetical protein [Amycolatopsis sp. H20-H5]MEC3975361.1 hypothetical protein [Amycolatopsis sp. H20-H5]